MQKKFKTRAKMEEFLGSILPEVPANKTVFDGPVVISQRQADKLRNMVGMTYGAEASFRLAVEARWDWKALLVTITAKILVTTPPLNSNITQELFGLLEDLD